MQIWPTIAPESTEPHESIAELGGHEVVEDRVDGGVDVDHDSGEVEQVVVRLDVEREHCFLWCHDDPEGEGAEGHQTHEEGQNHGA